jgi:hypothetical protein
MAFQWLTLLFEQRQDVHRIEDHVGASVGSAMPGDHLGPAGDDHFVDIATHPHLVMGIGHRHRIIGAAIAHHGDRGGLRADFLAGVIRRGWQFHQRIQIPHEPFADRLTVAAHAIVVALQAPVFQPGVQVIEAVEARGRHEEIAAPGADNALHRSVRHWARTNGAFNGSPFPLARLAEPVVEQGMRLQLGKGSCSFPFAVAADLRHRDRGVVVQDRQGHAAEEGEGGLVSVAKQASVVSAG